MAAMLLTTLLPHQRLWFLSLAKADLNDCRKAIAVAAHAAPNSDAYQALVEIAVVRYCRPWRQNRLPTAGDSTRLPDAYLPADPLNHGYQAFHAAVLSMRDQTSAHSDLTTRQVRVAGSQIDQVEVSNFTMDAQMLGQLSQLAQLIVVRIDADLGPLLTAVVPVVPPAPTTIVW